MRKLYVYMVIIALCACEVIDWNERLIPLPAQETAGSRRHVLLEFTGFRCVNCPEASELAQTLEEASGGQLYVVSLHPASNPFTQGKYDYTCPAADSIYQWMGGTASTPFPTGNVDMQIYEGGYFTDADEWASSVYKAGQDTVAPYLFFNAVIAQDGTRTVSATVTYTQDIKANLACWLVEDSVPGVQAMQDGSVNTAYYHRHVLRAAADNKPFGTPVTGMVTTVRIPVPEGCDTGHLYLLALLLDTNDNHILQAYETKLYPDGYMPPVHD